MSTQLDPTILRKLGAFSERRRRLIIIRGIAAAVATLLATMMVVALVDWLFVLREWQRWALSGEISKLQRRSTRERENGVLTLESKLL